MTKKEFEEFLVSIGGLVRGWKPEKGLIVGSEWFEVTEGWYQLISNLITELIELGWNKKVLQVKEKFGGLRFYIDSEDMPESGLEVIRKYESKSYEICDVCGGEGVLRSGSWLRTQCDEHCNGNEPFNLDTRKRLFGR